MKMNDAIRRYFGKRNITDMLLPNKKIFVVMPFMTTEEGETISLRDVDGILRAYEERRRKKRQGINIRSTAF